MKRIIEIYNLTLIYLYKYFTMRPLFSLFFLFLLNNIFSQQLITDDSVKLKRGIYRDFFEFKYNRPTIYFDNRIDSVETTFVGPFKKRCPHISYLVSLKKDQRKITNKIYGFCDGKNCYINNGEMFEKITFIGRYSIYNHITEDLKLPVPMPFGGLMFVNMKNGLSKFLIDMNNGGISYLHTNIVKEILMNDTTMINIFESDTNREDNLLSYIIEYSEKHNNEVQASDLDYTDADIIDFLNLQLTDTTFDIYYERIINVLPTIRNITDIKLYDVKYSNGNYKYIGLVAHHNLAFSPDYRYKIGYWRFFYKNGELKSELVYDLRENRFFEKKYIKNHSNN